MKGERKLDRKRGLVLIAILLTAVFLPLSLTADPRSASSALHPGLVQMVEDSPDQTVRLMVQKADQTSQALVLAKRLGGEVVHEFEFLNAFVVEMTGNQALELASSPFVGRISPDGEVEISNATITDSAPPETDASNTYVWSTNTDLARAKLGLSGEEVGVAIIDSGVDESHPCLEVEAAPFGSGDEFGHGTHVAGIIACENSNFGGMAPEVDLISLKVFDTEGHAYESDIVAALEWVYNNHDEYDIKVVNMSLNSTYEASYHESFMNAGAELLWFNGITVVVSVGNKGPLGGHNTVNTAPANDPFFIAVGASDEKDSYLRSNDEITNFSAYGVTTNGHVKPDVIAPGYNIISAYSEDSDWHLDYPEKLVGTQYVRLSGTSMSAPVVSGAVALLLEWKPDLTPDQVKYLLQNTGSMIYQGSDGYPYLDLYHLVLNAYYWDSYPSANTGEMVSQLLFTGDQDAWNSVAWNSVAWNSVAWNSVAWNSVAWNSVAWNSVAWNSVAWNSVAWNSVDLNGGVFWGKTRNPNAADKLDQLPRDQFELPVFDEITSDPYDAKPVKPDKIKGPKK